MLNIVFNIVCFLKLVYISLTLQSLIMLSLLARNQQIYLQKKLNHLKIILQWKYLNLMMLRQIWNLTILCYIKKAIFPYKKSMNKTFAKLNSLILYLIESYHSLFGAAKLARNVHNKCLFRMPMKLLLMEV